eukprot:2802425-Prymnesium_polylepis.1
MDKRPTEVGVTAAGLFFGAGELSVSSPSFEARRPPPGVNRLRLIKLPKARGESIVFAGLRD